MHQQAEGEFHMSLGLWVEQMAILHSCVAEWAESGRVQTDDGGHLQAGDWLRANYVRAESTGID